MPQKKRTSSKKKASNKKKSIDKNNINESKKTEEEEVYHKWARDGGRKVTAKSFSKNLPDRAEEIRQGGNVDDIAQEVTKSTLCSSQQTPVIIDKRDGKPNDPMALVFEELTTLVVPGRKRYHVLWEEVFQSMRMEFSKISKRYAMGEQKRESLLKDHDEGQLMLVIHQCFNEAMKQYGKRIIKECYRGNEPAFRNGCTIYGASLHDFGEETSSIMTGLLNSHEFDEETNQMHFNIHTAANQVKKGTDMAKKVCWECKKIDSGFVCCSRCHCAGYCSRECQVSA